MHALYRFQIIFSQLSSSVSLTNFALTNKAINYIKREKSITLAISDYARQFKSPKGLESEMITIISPELETLTLLIFAFGHQAIHDLAFSFSFVFAFTLSFSLTFVLP